MAKTSEIKVLVDPETRAQIDQARGLASISAWVREAIEVALDGHRELEEMVNQDNTQRVLQRSKTINRYGEWE